MRTTVDLPSDLVQEAMTITKARTKTEMLKIALANIVQQARREKILRYHGKLDLDIDMDILRDR